MFKVRQMHFSFLPDFRLKICAISRRKATLVEHGFEATAEE